MRLDCWIVFLSSIILCLIACFTNSPAIIANLIKIWLGLRYNKPLRSLLIFQRVLQWSTLWTSKNIQSIRKLIFYFKVSRSLWQKKLPNSTSCKKWPEQNIWSLYFSKLELRSAWLISTGSKLIFILTGSKDKA